MKIGIFTPGKYILAVSGGVDSVTLLHLLTQQMKNTVSQFPTLNAPTQDRGLELVVAHFNHGIRSDSVEDEKLVTEAAHRYNLLIEIGYGKLGAKVSEEKARQARYEFLESVSKKHKAKGIIMAHHQDDLIETVFINILRGTGRTGLSSIRHSKIYRPLLSVSKKEILAYAKKNRIQWREDSTNNDTRYLRNYIRTHIMSRLTGGERAKIINELDKVAKANRIIDDEIATISHLYLNNRLDRRIYVMLPTQVGEELLMNWLRQNKLRNFDKKTIKRLAIAIKTGQPGSRHEIMKGRRLKLTVRWADLI